MGQHKERHDKRSRRVRRLVESFIFCITTSRKNKRAMEVWKGRKGQAMPDNSLLSFLDLFHSCTKIWKGRHGRNSSHINQSVTSLFIHTKSSMEIRTHMRERKGSANSRKFNSSTMLIKRKGGRRIVTRSKTMIMYSASFSSYRAFIDVFLIVPFY
jgi:hypothetical protein